MADSCTIVFDVARFRIRYPVFTATSDALLSAYFDEASLYFSNDCCNIVKSQSKRELLLWMLTAHIAVLNGAFNPNGQPGMVGRVSNAAEGSVSIASEYNVPMSAAWFAQTAYGAQFWQATAQYRTFRYRPRPTRF